MPRIQTIAAALLAGLLLAAPAQALYIQTPLLLIGPERAEVGDEVSFDIQPANASAAEKFAGKTLRIVYRFDPNETTSEGAATVEEMQERLLQEIVLGNDARTTFAWTVPEEVRDLNVDVVVLSGNEPVAFSYLAVGDAPPSMRILAASGPAAVDTDADEHKENAPGLGLAAIAAIGLVAVLRRRS